MLKVNYEFTALQPIHTGSDENTGTERKLRREKILLKNSIHFKSIFPETPEGQELKRQAILSVLHHIWKCIDFEGMQKGRLLSIWDEFTSKVLASTAVRTKEQFLNILCQKMGIRSLANDYSDKLPQILNKFSNEEFLYTLREELQYLILRLRVMTKKKDENKNLSLFDLNNSEKEIEKNNQDVTFTKSFESVPYISGNSIRGYLRRVFMYDFCKLTDIKSLQKNVYHQLFTGGNITDSTGKESLENREKFIAMCPGIGLLGSAIGNQTIEGELKVGGARPQCLEHGTGNLSFWELVETKFQTRHDTSKTEQNINIVDNNKTKSDPTTQMIYQYETFIVGSKFNHTFALITDSDLLTSAFWHMLTLFKEYNYICGNSARDAGLIDINISIPENSNQLYLDYLESNKEEIQKYFSTSNKELTLLAGG